MILSKTCDYGIRAAMYVAMQKDKEFVPIRKISEDLNISFHFLTKILQILTQSQIMTSFRGPNGGVSLTRPADRISLKEIIFAIDGPRLFQNCLLGLDRCNDKHPCPIHDKWYGVRAELDDILSNTTLAELGDKVIQGGYRMTEIIQN
jgi:Rrf2 family iron-sulfur cluster assembly transcriptional regulator